MCGAMKEIGKVGLGVLPSALLGLGQDRPSATRSDPAAEQAAADARAAQGANTTLAAKNKRRSSSILATGAGDTGVLNTATGIKTTLGA